MVRCDSEHKESVMDDIPTSSKIIDGLLAIMAALVIWFTKRSVKQYDERISSLEQSVAGTVSRNEFREYLEGRDRLSEDRHQENLDNFRDLFNVSSANGERVARLEGVITRNHR